MDYFTSLQLIWDYLVLNQSLSKSDCILVFGGHDKSVAVHAANLYHEGFSDTVIVSGGIIRDGALFGLQYPLSEAEALSTILKERGVPSDRIFLENKATNTRENFLNIAKILEAYNLNFSKFIVVQKPYAERRTYALGLTVWPDKTIILTSIKKSLSEYLSCGIAETLIVEMMLGEVERIREYPKRGYMIFQEIPEDIINAYNYIRSKGFTGREIKVVR